MTQMMGYEAKQKAQANQHFFAASPFDWATTTEERDLPALIRLMERKGNGFNLFLVPVPHDTNYEINFYQPQVEGTQWLGYFDKKGGRK
jgi:hypothetical protein